MRRAASLLNAQHHRRIAPQTLEAIERALLGDERVHDHVAEVDEHPAAAAQPLDAERTAARLRRLLHDALRDPLDLTLAASAEDHEQVGDRRDLRYVHDDDVLGLLVGSDIDDEVSERARAQLSVELVSDTRALVRASPVLIRELRSRPRPR